MTRLLVTLQWIAMAVTALAFGWTVGGRMDWFSAAGVIALIVWMLCARALKATGTRRSGQGARASSVEPDLSRLDRLDGVGNRR